MTTKQQRQALENIICDVLEVHAHANERGGLNTSSVCYHVGAVLRGEGVAIGVSYNRKEIIAGLRTTKYELPAHIMYREGRYADELFSAVDNRQLGDVSEAQIRGALKRLEAKDLVHNPSWMSNKASWRFVDADERKRRQAAEDEGAQRRAIVERLRAATGADDDESFGYSSTFELTREQVLTLLQKAGA